MHDIDDNGGLDDDGRGVADSQNRDTRRNDPRDDRWAFIADVRDGLTRAQRIVLYEIHKAQQDTGRDFIPTVMLYGRVVEHLNISEAELQAILQSLGVMGDAPRGKTSA